MSENPSHPAAALLAALDPRLRLVCGAGLIVAALVAQGPAAQSLSACAALAAALACEYSLARLLKRLAVIAAALVPLWLLLPLPLGDAPRMEIFGLAFERDGLLAAATTTRIALTVGLLGVSFFAPIPGLRLAWALQGLRVPSKLVDLLTYASLSLNHLQRDWLRLTRAWRVRGFTLTMSRPALFTLGNGIGLLVASAVRRGRNMEAALSTRGFDGRWPSLDSDEPGLSDWLVFVMWMLLVVVMVGFTLAEVSV